MDANLFRRFAAIAYERSGISIKTGKEELVASRVARRVQALGLDGARAYLDLLEADEGDELRRFVDAISTNFTSFFREPDHFTLLGELVSRMAAEGQPRLRLWSAAASSGEEAYSMAITVIEALRGREMDFKILATDICTKILDQARSGTYTSARLTAIPESLRRRYFTPLERGSEQAKVNPEVAEHVSFRALNLSAPPYPMSGPFDLVMCRNVMIYFDQAVRQRLISAIEPLVRPDGWLCIGHVETLAGIKSGFRLVRPSIFHLPDTGSAHAK